MPELEHQLLLGYGFNYRGITVCVHMEEVEEVDQIRDSAETRPLKSSGVSDSLLSQIM